MEMEREKLLTEDQERALFARLRNGDSEAGNEIATHYEPLIKSLAHRFRARNYAVSKEEFVSAGHEGLARALIGFDPARNVRFGTYARFSIMRKMDACIRTEKWWAPSVSTTTYRHLVRFARARASLRRETGSEPSIEDLAHAVGTHQLMARTLLAWLASTTISLSTPVGRDDSSLSEFICSDEDYGERWVRQEKLRAAIREILLTLPARKRQILKLRFGMDGKEEQTLSAIGKKFGITPERVRQIEGEAMTALRQSHKLSTLRT
jgi:RNA polymerase primary sigma factor